MKYRNFKNELQISQLGLGCMRFPVLNDDNAKIDEEQAERMILHCYENGVNYYDTAYPYHVGTSEKFVGKVIQKNRLRDKIHLATKIRSGKSPNTRDFTTCLKNNCKICKQIILTFI